MRSHLQRSSGMSSLISASRWSGGSRTCRRRLARPPTYCARMSGSCARLCSADVSSTSSGLDRGIMRGAVLPRRVWPIQRATRNCGASSGHRDDVGLALAERAGRAGPARSSILPVSSSSVSSKPISDYAWPGREVLQQPDCPRRAPGWNSGRVPGKWRHAAARQDHGLEPPSP